jgi:ABC-type multidrug transport system ATPase subunit
MEIKNVTKLFNDKVIFKDFSASIPENKITFIMGESGSGKTTLLKMICGLDKQFEGEILLSSNKLSCVFQEPRLFPTLTAKENIELVEKGGDLSSEDVLKLVELDRDSHLYPNELSGGMKMRLSIARALYYNGDIFVLDEPFSALDEELKDRILNNIFDALRDKTVIIVSHNPEEAQKYADNLIKL